MEPHQFDQIINASTMHEPYFAHSCVHNDPESLLHIHDSKLNNHLVSGLLFDIVRIQYHLPAFESSVEPRTGNSRRRTGACKITVLGPYWSIVIRGYNSDERKISYFTLKFTDTFKIIGMDIK